MSLDYPNRAEWLAKRNNPVAGSRVHGRIVATGTVRRRRPGPTHVGKSELRALKKARMAQMYADFETEFLKRCPDDVSTLRRAWLRGEIKKFREEVICSFYTTIPGYAET